MYVNARLSHNSFSHEILPITVDGSNKEALVGRIAVLVEEVVGLISRKVVEDGKMAEITKEVDEVEVMKEYKVVIRTTQGAFKVDIKERVVAEV